MPRVDVGTDNGRPAELHHQDVGAGRPVVLIHGGPLSGRSWEAQAGPLVAAGHRVVTHDRRGFGDSSQPWNAYADDTSTADLHPLLEHLDLRDVALAGFMPLEVSGKRMHELIPGGELVLIEGGPHGINSSHPEQFNDAPIAFLAR
jgi:pimeloyl-ACP methyl ester carboxylesterase